MSKTEEIYIKQEEAARCRRLLLAVVDQAVRDACLQPVEKRPQRDAVSALNFLLSKNIAGLAEYAAWLDFDADMFRAKLLERMHSYEERQINGFDPLSRRHFRINYQLWLANQDIFEAQQLATEDE
jgi:hypothetical protein